VIIITGLSHHTAPISVREKVALSEEAARELVKTLGGSPGILEVFIVSTCNRFEIIAVSLDESESARQLCASSCKSAITERSLEAEGSIYSHHGLNAVRHLVRVASSLDSLVVGEAQILGQLKQGFERARDAETVGAHLHQLFARVARGAKRVRTETTIGVGQVSVPSIAVDLALQIFGNLSGRKVALIGSGEMGQTVARLLHEAGAELIVLGRDIEKISVVAAKVGGRAQLMQALPAVLKDVDVVVSSTSAPGAVVRVSDLEERRKSRKTGNLFFIDLAVPRDIEPGVGELDGVFLYDVDDLSQVASESATGRKKAADEAEAIVHEVVTDWERRESALQITPTIKALRAKMRLALESELNRSLRGKLRELDDEQRGALSKMLDAGLNRIMHDPATHLREEAARREGNCAVDLAQALSALFELEELPDEEMDVSSVRLPAHDSKRISDSRIPLVSPAPSSGRGARAK